MTQIVLVTGLSGSGKSALSRYLTARGERAISLDAHPGLCRWEDTERQPVTRPEQPDPGWLQRHAWNWVPAVLDDLVAAEGKEGHRRVFLCGMAANQELFLDRFDLVLMLDIGRDAMLTRLDNTSRGNDFGRAGASEQVLADRYEPDRERMLATARHVVDVSVPVEVVANMICGLAAIHQDGALHV